MGSVDQKPAAIPKWVQWTKSQTQDQNGYSGPKARHNTKMGSVDQKPDTIPKWVQWTKSQRQCQNGFDSLGWIPQCSKGFFSQSAVSVGSRMVLIQTPCVIACIHVCAHIVVKNPNCWQPYHCVDSRRCCVYCSVGNGKHLLLHLLVTFLRQPRFSWKGLMKDYYK